MLKIRLQRTGRINDPSFRVVVVEHTESTKTGSIIEQVGTYSPKTKVKNLKEDRIKYWISVGAQASGTVHNMLISAGIISGKKINVLPKKSPSKKDSEQQTVNSEQKVEKTEEAKTEEAKDEAPAEAAKEATEAPVEMAEAKTE